jgi:hypothetical protein
MKFWKLLPLLLLLCVPSASAQERDARVPGGVVVRQGKEIKLKGVDLKIGFVAVTQDSRCPDGAKCIWAGNARVHLIARNSKDECVEFDLNTNLKPNMYEFGGYKIALAQLTPAPSIHGLPKAEDYAATIVVEKSGKK